MIRPRKLLNMSCKSSPMDLNLCPEKEQPMLFPSSGKFTVNMKARRNIFSWYREDFRPCTKNSRLVGYEKVCCWGMGYFYYQGRSHEQECQIKRASRYKMQWWIWYEGCYIKVLHLVIWHFQGGKIAGISARLPLGFIARRWLRQCIRHNWSLESTMSMLEVKSRR